MRCFDINTVPFSVASLVIILPLDTLWGSVASHPPAQTSSSSQSAAHALPQHHGRHVPVQRSSSLQYAVSLPGLVVCNLKPPPKKCKKKIPPTIFCKFAEKSHDFLREQHISDVKSRNGLHGWGPPRYSRFLYQRYTVMSGMLDFSIFF